MSRSSSWNFGHEIGPKEGTLAEREDLIRSPFVPTTAFGRLFRGTEVLPQVVEVG